MDPQNSGPVAYEPPATAASKIMTLETETKLKTTTELRQVADMPTYDFSPLAQLYTDGVEWQEHSEAILMPKPDSEYRHPTIVAAVRLAETMLLPIDAARERSVLLHWQPEFDRFFEENALYHCGNVKLFDSPTHEGSVYHIGWRYFVIVVMDTSTTPKNALGYHYFELTKKEAIAKNCF